MTVKENELDGGRVLSIPSESLVALQLNAEGDLEVWIRND